MSVGCLLLLAHAGPSDYIFSSSSMSLQVCCKLATGVACMAHHLEVQHTAAAKLECTVCGLQLKMAASLNRFFGVQQESMSNYFNGGWRQVVAKATMITQPCSPVCRWKDEGMRGTCAAAHL